MNIDQLLEALLNSLYDSTVLYQLKGDDALISDFYYTPKELCNMFGCSMNELHKLIIPLYDLSIVHRFDASDYQDRDQVYTPTDFDYVMANNDKETLILDIIKKVKDDYPYIWE